MFEKITPLPGRDAAAVIAERDPEPKMEGLLKFSAQGSYSGEVLLEYPVKEGLPHFLQASSPAQGRCVCCWAPSARACWGELASAALANPVQEPPVTPQDGEAAAARLREAYLTPRLEGAAGDVAHAGASRGAVSPLLCAGSLAPSQPSLATFSSGAVSPCIRAGSHRLLLLLCWRGGRPKPVQPQPLALLPMLPRPLVEVYAGAPHSVDGALGAAGRCGASAARQPGPKGGRGWGRLEGWW